MTQPNFFLSDIPFEYLQLNTYFITSCTGKAGMITKVEVVPSGRYNDVYMNIVWDDPNTPDSYVKWPDDCTKLKVDLTKYPEFCQPFCEAQIRRLEIHKYFFDFVNDHNPHRVGSAMWACHPRRERNTGERNNVQDNAIQA